MSSVLKHYEQLLAPIYSWMLGDLEVARQGAHAELLALGVEALAPGTAVDLGAGPGVHAVPLAAMGFSVVAVDSSDRLLRELSDANAAITTVCGDLLSFRQHAPHARVVLCMGDTLTHLPDAQAVERLFLDVAAVLEAGGLFLATFRDYVTAPLQGTARFIPVKHDGDRIMTCFLEYADTTVMVHDILQQRGPSGWVTSVSAYPKLRLDPGWVREALARAGLEATLEAGVRGMVKLTGRKHA